MGRSHVSMRSKGVTFRSPIVRSNEVQPGQENMSDYSLNQSNGSPSGARDHRQVEEITYVPETPNAETSVPPKPPENMSATQLMQYDE